MLQTFCRIILFYKFNVLLNYVKFKYIPTHINMTIIVSYYNVLMLGTSYFV